MVYNIVGSGTLLHGDISLFSHPPNGSVPDILVQTKPNMYFVRASLSVTMLSFFLDATYAQVNDPKSSSTIPTVTALHQTTITNQPAQLPCLVTVNGIAFDTCVETSHPAELSTTSESQLPRITSAPLLENCLVTINGIVYNTCNTFVSTIGDSPITMAPQHTRSNALDQAKCIISSNGGLYNTCGLFLSIIRGCSIMMAPRHTPSNTLDQANCFTTIDGRVSHTCAGADTSACEELSDCRQLNAPCLTTLTAPEGHAVVVDCEGGFESGHPRTVTSLSPPPSSPTTVCVENRCYDVIGTFGSPASANATPTQTISKDEL
jgi:hypothetical protein